MERCEKNLENCLKSYTQKLLDPILPDDLIWLITKYIHNRSLKIFVLGIYDGEQVFHNDREMYIKYKFRAYNMKDVLSYILFRIEPYEAMQILTCENGYLSETMQSYMLQEKIMQIEDEDDIYTFLEMLDPNVFMDVARKVYQKNLPRLLLDINTNSQSVTDIFLIPDTPLFSLMGHYASQYDRPCINVYKKDEEDDEEDEEKSDGDDEGIVEGIVDDDDDDDDVSE
jgi:hypothetical protein